MRRSALPAAPLCRHCAGAAGAAGGGARAWLPLSSSMSSAGLFFFIVVGLFFVGGDTKLNPRGPRVTTYHSSLLLKPLTIKNLAEAE